MAINLYLPQDQIKGDNPDFDLTADYLELTAFFSDESRSFTKDLINASEIGAEEDYADVDEEITQRDEIVSGTVKRISARINTLKEAYPFSLDDNGDILTFQSKKLTYGKTAYLLSLILSHLRSVSPILDGSRVYPSDNDIRQLRQYFQYFATAALAAEIGGNAWSFGHPRPDHSCFFNKLKEIWQIFKDGIVDPDASAPQRPQDDQVDIFAARTHADGLPGFLLAAAQVATGGNWKDKSLVHHIENVFPSRWFSRQPVTKIICYHIIPFSRPDAAFRDDCRILGNLLHRLRMPLRVHEANVLYKQGTQIEAYDELKKAVKYIKKLRKPKKM